VTDAEAVLVASKEVQGDTRESADGFKKKITR